MAKLGSKEYLYEEMNRLRKMWGTKTFWSDLDKARRALYGFIYVVFHTDNLEKSDISLIQAVCFEFEKRLALVLSIKDTVRS